MPLLPQYRAGIMAEAASHLGAHYVWGATGNYPNMISGFMSPIASAETNRRYSSRLSMRLNMPDSSPPFFCTAGCQSRGPIRTCNGRSFLPEVRVRRRFELAWLHDSARVTAALANPNDWIWPRGNDEPLLDGPLVWDEPCFGRQHFDCIGFINYCILRVCGAAHHPSIIPLGNSPMMFGENATHKIYAADFLQGRYR